MKVEALVPRLVLYVLHGQQLAESRAVAIEVDGYPANYIDLPPAQFRVLSILTKAWLDDEATDVHESIRGFRLTNEIATQYKDLLNNHTAPNTQYITYQIMLIRRAIKNGLLAFEIQNKIHFDRKFLFLPNRLGYGYRVGEISSSILDLNTVKTLQQLAR